MKNLQIQSKKIIHSNMLYSLNVLSLSGFELNEFINENIETNPLLEYDYSYKNEIDFNKFIENMKFESISLYDHLVRELNLINKLNDSTLKVVENLSDEGYLLLDDSEFDLNSLKIVRSLTPYGVGAKDYKDSLKIQLKMKGVKEKLVYSLVDNHLDDIAYNNFSKIISKLNINEEKLLEYIEIIKSLDPKPGLKYSSFEKINVIPDAFIFNNGNNLEIVLNDKLFKNLMVTNIYDNIDNSEAKDYIKRKRKDALLLVESLNQRKTTLFKILEFITQYQDEFFKKGYNYLKGLTLEKISKKINLNISTVSRAIKDKYFYYNKDVYKFSFFLSKGINSARGFISINVIKNIIETIIKNEDKRKPYSDSNIKKTLEIEGIKISRRTVSKYREELNILNSFKRKLNFK